jgi:hypothetical protein
LLFIDNVLGVDSVSADKQVDQCRVISVSEVKKFTEEQKVALANASLDIEEGKFLQVGRVMKGSVCLHSRQGSRAKKQNSFTISCDRAVRSDDMCGIEVDCYLLHKAEKRLYAIGIIADK